MRDYGLTQPAVALEAIQQRCLSRLGRASRGFKAKELSDDPKPGAPGGCVATGEHARGRRAEMMCGFHPWEKPAVKTIILEDDATANRAAELWARQNDRKAGSGTWRWWTD
jgi:hypothetical protein